MFQLGMLCPKPRFPPSANTCLSLTLVIFKQKCFNNIIPFDSWAGKVYGKANLGLDPFYFISYLRVSTNRRAMRFLRFSLKTQILLIPQTAGSGTSEHCQARWHSLELGDPGPVGSERTRKACNDIQTHLELTKTAVFIFLFKSHSLKLKYLKLILLYTFTKNVKILILFEFLSI